MSSHALLISWFFFGVVLTVGVGVHANNRGRSGFIWGLLTLLTGVIGAFVYSLVILTGDGAPNEEDPDHRRVCPNCSATHTGRPEYCNACGEALGSDDDKPTGTILRTGSQGYCSNCKKKSNSTPRPVGIAAPCYESLQYVGIEPPVGRVVFFRFPLLNIGSVLSILHDNQ